MKKNLTNYIFFFFGLVLFGLGNGLAVKVKYLGIHPWEVLNVALFQQFGYTIGTWSVLVGLLLIVISLFIDRKYINLGTFLNALLVGPFMDLFLWSGLLPQASNTWTDYVVLVCAIIISGTAGGMYVAAGIGAGPRDGFMLSISDKTKLSVSNARICVESIVLLIGYLLGGPVFVVTFFYTLLMSPIFQFMLRHFRKLIAYLNKETPHLQAGS